MSIVKRVKKITAKGTAKKSHAKKRHHFLAAWVRSPLSMGAILPSSRALARAMAAQVDYEKPGMVIELGAGTGVVTHALVKAGVDKKRLLVIERDKKLHAILESQFKSYAILCEDAQELESSLKQHKVDQVNAIVSSLPLITLPKRVETKIIQQMVRVIGQEGIIVQFTYGPRSPINPAERKKHQLIGKRVKTVLTNVPPAHVWVYRRG